VDYFGRNTVWGFNTRAIKNLEFINGSPSNAVHKVTALLTSLVALIVFPFEYLDQCEKNIEALRKYKLKDLANLGWYKWSFEEPTEKWDSPADLYSLIFHLRNAISHRRIHFSNESSRLEDVDIRFTDRPGDNKPDNWATTINALDLYKFTLRFAELLRDFEEDLN
jgi:hypothetical protein